MKKLFLVLTLIILSISFYPVKAMERTSDILKKNVVTSGEGLYIDNTINGRYIYKGANPNNYIKLGDDLYRIISVEKDGTIKVISTKKTTSFNFFDGYDRKSTGNNDYCTGSYGCNAWGSNTTTLDSNGNKVTQMSKELGGSLYNLPDKEASLNTYLNNDFYNSLSDEVKDFIVTKEWNIGPTIVWQSNLLDSIKEESSYKWKGKVALMNVTDYVKASNNPECTTVNDFSSYGSKPSCYNNASKYTYLSLGSWIITLSPLSSYPGDVIYIPSWIQDQRATTGGSVYPAFFLSSKTTLNGEGTVTNPYTVSKYIEEPKNEESNENNEENNQNVNNGQIVEVPSTSAQMSIIIASIGIIFVSLAIIITKKMTITHK